MYAKDFHWSEECSPSLLGYPLIISMFREVPGKTRAVVNYNSGESANPSAWGAKRDVALAALQVEEPE
jgi:hypothetical protein